jgi:cytosine/adenosine deaminase-related metal-dependent hydrolase
MSFTIQNVLLPTVTGYETGDVQVQGDRITAIGAGLPPAGTVVDGTNKLLLPGFVNAHTHSPEMWQRGLIPPLPLELWLAELHDFAPPDPEQVYLSALGTAVETLLSGGTTVVDHLVLIPGKELETIAAAAKAYQEVGIRAFIGPLIQDQSLPAGIPTGGQETHHEPHYLDTEATLALMREAIARFHRPKQNIQIMVAPTGLQLCSDDLFTGCIELSDRHHLCRHTHLLETKAQKLLAFEKYGCSATGYLQRLGFLGGRTSLAHCVWVDEADIPILVNSRATVVHNPLSNLRLGSGIAPILKYLAAGVNVAFGCDGSASNDSQDLLEAIKIGTILHNTTDPEYQNWITPRKALEMAALGGATGLGMAGQSGTLSPGKLADLVLYDLSQLSLLPRTDPIGLLVLGRPVNPVHSAWVSGRPVIQNGAVTTVNVPALKQRLFEQSQWQVNRHSQSKQSMEAGYRSIMNLQPG